MQLVTPLPSTHLLRSLQLDRVAAGLDGEFFPDSQGTASFRDLVIYFLASPEERQQYHNLVALSHTVRWGVVL